MEQLRRSWCATVALALCLWSVPAAAQTELTATPARVGIADGRTVVPIWIKGGPVRPAWELSRAPALPRVECQGAVTLSASTRRPVAVLAPISTAAITVPCQVTLRGESASFELRFRAAPPGLYAELTGIADDGSVASFRAFHWNGRARAAPTALRVGSSEGTSSVVAADRFDIALEHGRAPRTLSVALADGDRTGAAFVPLVGAAALPISAARGSRVEVRIAGQVFGPAEVTGSRVTVPIKVPPGTSRAVVRVTSGSGRIREFVSDLGVPGHRRIAAAVGDVAPGADTTIAIATSGTNGRPALGNADVRVSVDSGEVGEVFSAGGGLFGASFRAPDELLTANATATVRGDRRAGSVVVPIEVTDQIAPPPSGTGGSGAVDDPHTGLGGTDPGSRPPRAVIGLFGYGAFFSGEGDVEAPRLHVGVTVARSLGDVELSAAIGVELFKFSGSLDEPAPGFDRSLTGVGFPVVLRGRFAVAPSFGFSLGFALVPIRVSTTVTPDQMMATEASELVTGVRGEMSFDVPLGPGRFRVGAGIGTAKVSLGAAGEGGVDGLAAFAGYELPLVTL